MSRLFWAVIASLLALSSACDRDTATTLDARRRNLVLITVDTLRADHLGCYGYESASTPNIDDFAASGTRFDRATTVSNNTLPSHAAMLTGRYPHEIGIPRNGYRLADDHETLATILQGHGYETAAFISASALSAPLGLDRGFASFDEEFDTEELDQGQRRAGATTERVVAWLEQPRRSPFFLWVHYFDPHSPYSPPAPYDDRFYPEYEGSANGSIAYLCGVSGTMGFAKIETTPDDHRKLVALYDGEIAYLDEELGGLFGALDDERLRDETAVILVADHGESLTEHGYYFAHGEHLYQASMRVPLIARLPWESETPGRVVESPVESIDVFATALAALGVPRPESSPSPSRDLSPLMRGISDDDTAPSFGESSRPWSVEARVPGRWPNLPKAHFVLRYPWKLILTPYRSRVELYDLATDPGELHNVATSHSALASELERELRSWRRSGRQATGEADRENMEKLRALGYLE